jgi:hypothetical protein
MKTKLLILAVLLLIISGVGYYYNQSRSGVMGDRYVNKEYGFEVTLPASWNNVIVNKRTVENVPAVAMIEFSFRTLDKNWPNEEVTIWNVFVYPKEVWYESEELAEQHVRKIGENDKYVFGSYSSQDAPDDLHEQYVSIREAGDSFRNLR